MLPVTDIIIRAVEEIAAADKQTGFRHRTASQHIPCDPAWTAGVDYEEDAHDDTYQDEEEESDDESDSEWLKVDVEDDDPNEIQEYPVQTEIDHQEEDQVDEDEVEEHQEDEPVEEFESVEVEDVVETEDDDPNEAEEPVQQARTSRYGRTLRQPTSFEPRMTGRYHEVSHLQQTKDNIVEEYPVRAAQVVVNFVQMYQQERHKESNNLVTYSLTKGLRKFEGRGFESAFGEMEQLHNRHCFTPIDVRSMSPNERKKAMESLIFLVEKKFSQKLKSRHCANGSVQREWMRAEDTSSPTVMTESVYVKQLCKRAKLFRQN